MDIGFVGVPVASDEKYGRLKQLMDVGKEKGYVLYDEVNELLADDFTAGRELDDLLSDLDTAGVEILEEPKLEFDKKIEDGEEFSDLDVAQVNAATTLNENYGSVRLDYRFNDKYTLYARYFREMLDRGIFLAPSQFEAAFVSAAHSEADIDRAVEAARQCLPLAANDAS